MADGPADLTEEHVTLAILEALKAAKWDIVAFDFPQSGTGRSLSPNVSSRAGRKTKGRVIPDIVAVSRATCLVLENKPLFYAPDVEKLVVLRDSGEYSEALEALVRGMEVKRFLYGIGLPLLAARGNAGTIRGSLDVCLGVSPDRTVEVVVPTGVRLSSLNRHR